MPENKETTRIVRGSTAWPTYMSFIALKLEKLGDIRCRDRRDVGGGQEIGDLWDKGLLQYIKPHITEKMRIIIWRWVQKQTRAAPIAKEPDTQSKLAALRSSVFFSMWPKRDLNPRVCLGTLTWDNSAVKYTKYGLQNLNPKYGGVARDYSKFLCVDISIFQNFSTALTASPLPHTPRKWLLLKWSLRY